MKHYLMKISYDGSTFNGWQRLKSNPDTIQQIIEDILGTHICGSGRTDAGVHAMCQYADFYYNNIIDFSKFITRINAKLPDSIRVISLSEVCHNFHSRKDASSKTYSYYISLNNKCDVFSRKYTYNLTDTPVFYKFDYKNCTDTIDSNDINSTNHIADIDLNKMEKAAGYLCGTHDFSAFTSDKSKDKSHIRTIYEIKTEIINTDKCAGNSHTQTPFFIDNGLTLKISVTGNGFLYNMVRIIAGTLIYCGLSRINADELPVIIEKGIRKNAGPTLPSNALFLENVIYKNNSYMLI